LATLTLDGRSLALDDLAPIFRGDLPKLKLAPAALERVKAARALVERALDSGQAIYGLTTGFGKLKNVPIARADPGKLQENLVLSHCCGMGEPMPLEEVRAVQVLRLNKLLRGHSGVRVELVEALVRFFHKGFVPFVPQQGSVGASGDLAPLAHMAAACMGHGEAFVGGKKMGAAAALRVVHEEPLELQAKEGLALINGTEVIGAIGAGVFLRARNLSKCADAIASLTIEALFGSNKPFDERLADLKGLSGHLRAAYNVRACLAESKVLESHVDCDRVQDPYSLRCVPQVHGAFKQALEHVEYVLAAEMNSVTDNPVLFPDTGEVVSAGQFHGQPLAMVLDYLALALHARQHLRAPHRAARHPDLSHLPGFLAANPGLHSGMMIAQVAAAALASENKSLAHPASVDTIPTSANQEDHVSMGVTAARKARSIVTNVERVLAIECLCAAQARDFHPEFRAGKGAQAVQEAVRKRVPPLEKDRLHDDLVAAHELIVRASSCARSRRRSGRCKPELSEILRPHGIPARPAGVYSCARGAHRWNHLFGRGDRLPAPASREDSSCGAGSLRVRCPFRRGRDRGSPGPSAGPRGPFQERPSSSGRRGRGVASACCDPRATPIAARRR
jgi:histidine ammonia-lyase